MREKTSTMVNKRRVLGAIFIYVLVALSIYWSIIFGKNIMIYDSEYEYQYQLIVSDALKQGSIPFWIPLLNYGIPYYAFVDVPVWYPLTLFLNIIGYGPCSVAVEYCIHIVIAAVGVFSLFYFDKSPERKGKFFVSLLSGLLYGFSGVFISNAQHMPIIISAAWIPYVFLLTKIYVDRKSKSIILLAGILCGFLILGGYPEILANLFIVIFTWFVYQHYLVTHSRLKAVLSSFVCTIVLGISTVLSAAITIIPFMTIIPKMTRGPGQTPISPPYLSLLTSIFPVTLNKIIEFEPSMGFYYFGFISIILLLSQRHINKYYLSMLAFSLLASLGDNFLIYPLLQRIVPLYSTFRMASLWRIFFEMFLLLIICDGIYDLFYDNRNTYVFKRVAGVAFWCGIIVLAIMKLVKVLYNNDFDILVSGAVIFSIFAGGYYIWAVTYTRYKGSFSNCVLFLLVLSEIFVVSNMALPYLIAHNSTFEYFYNDEAREYVDKYMNDYDNRNFTKSFMSSIRTKDKNFVSIALNKQLDEGGYVIIRFKSTEDYKKSYINSIKSNNPEIYFTSNIVDEQEVGLSDWQNKADVPQEQIHIEKKNNHYKSSTIEYDYRILDHRIINYDVEGTTMVVNNDIPNDDSETVKIRVYIDDRCEQLPLSLVFYDYYDNVSSYAGDFSIRTDNTGRYVEIASPSASGSYKKLLIENINNVSVEKVVYVKYSKTSYDKSVSTTGFSCNSISAVVDASSDGILTVLQNYYPGWNVYVDGIKREIVRVDGNFMGVELNQGTHKVDFRFRPTDFFVGLFVSILYYSIFILVLLKEVIIDKKTNAEGNCEY